LLPFIQAGARRGRPARAIARCRRTTFGLCMTDRKDNRVPWPKPAGYDPAPGTNCSPAISRNGPDVKMGQLMNPVVAMPNDKTDTNNNGPSRPTHIGAQLGLSGRGDDDQRERIREDHVRYTQGFLYFLANDPRVPPALQKEMRRWGLGQG